jgi:hypothetical protein
MKRHMFCLVVHWQCCLTQAIGQKPRWLEFSLQPLHPTRRQSSDGRDVPGPLLESPLGCPIAIHVSAFDAARAHV